MESAVVREGLLGVVDRDRERPSSLKERREQMKDARERRGTRARALKLVYRALEGTRGRGGAVRLLPITSRKRASSAAARGDGRTSSTLTYHPVPEAEQISARARCKQDRQHLEVRDDSRQLLDIRGSRAALVQSPRSLPDHERRLLGQCGEIRGVRAVCSLLELTGREISQCDCLAFVVREGSVRSAVRATRHAIGGSNVPNEGPDVRSPAFPVACSRGSSESAQRDSSTRHAQRPTQRTGPPPRCHTESTRAP